MGILGTHAIDEEQVCSVKKRTWFPNPNLPHCQLPSPHENKGNLVGLVKPNHLKCLKLTLLWAEGTTLSLSLSLGSSSPLLSTLTTVELKVEMVGIHEKRLRKCLSKLKGIEKVEVDVSSQKVMVTGYVHRNKILKAIRRGGLKADFWSTQDELLSVYASA
ncbi:hypothetical protein H0E87_011514, partial [Populus deltoides]